MGRPVATLLVLCFISVTARAAAFRVHGRLLADAATEGGAVVPIHWTQAMNYVANFTIGTPPQPASAVIDLAGELVWTQCKQCGRCFEQGTPLFDPTASNTYRAEPCGTPLCESIPSDVRNCSGNVCAYEASTNAGDTGGKAVKKAVTVAVGAPPMATPVEPFDLCFPKSGASGAAPDLVFTFRGGAAMTVPATNYLLDYKNGTVCLAMLSSARLNSTTELSLLGSLQQENIHFLFDLDKETLSFEPADCTKLS
ncbi:hypothetical protein OsJ_32292 [Oryza sativa Japonica Group]|uniref:Peptidase A1 domain-containing protein n=1 Tax=Oryza sativa subsp. japonica TaxID=39947 RepID=A3C6V7_ORYSJ|nr:hypothetical protein OsJ_32292 [Oryza sativa Japonica Group]